MKICVISGTKNKKMFCTPIPKTIHQMISVLYFLGLWKHKDDRITYWQCFYFISFALLVLCVSLGAYLTNNTDEVVYLTVITFMGVVQLCRLYCIIGKQNQILSLTHETAYNHTDDSAVFSDADRKLKNMMTLTKLFVCMMFCAISTVLSLPIFSSEKHLIFNIAFPLDYKNHRYAFWMAHAFIAVGSYVSAICCLFVAMVWYMMLNIVIKYEMLGNELRNFGVREGKTPSVKHGNILLSSIEHQRNLYLQHFVETIKIHENSNKNLEEFVSTFTNLFLLQIVTSSVCICGSINTLAFSSHENLVQDGFYFAIIFYCLFDSFMLMYLGNEIKLSTDRLSYCLFESDWMEQTDLIRKYFLIVTERLKRPQELRGGKLFPLNLATFTSIVNRSYSMFNILQSLRQ